MSTFEVILFNLSVCLAGMYFVAGEVKILTATNVFQIQNQTAEIQFNIEGVGDGLIPEVFISKKYPCLDISEPIFIGKYLTDKARKGVNVTNNGYSYTMHFTNAQEMDKGTYIVSVLQRNLNRYEHITNRSINLIGRDEKELKEVCNDNSKCDGWKVGFAVVFVLFIVALSLCIFVFIRFMQIETEEDIKKEEDIYVLQHIGSASTAARNDGPTDPYEVMDEENKGATKDDNTYMIPSEDEAEKDPGQSSEPEDAAPGIPGTEADGAISSDYDIPSKVLESNAGNTRDVLNTIPDNRRTSDIAPTLPSHYNRPPKGSVATIASETAAIVDPYERISYGKYARRFQRLRPCSIL